MGHPKALSLVYKKVKTLPRMVTGFVKNFGSFEALNTAL